MSDTSLVFNILAKDKATKTFDKIKGAAAVAGVAIGAALAAGVASTVAKSKTDALLAAQLGAGPEMAGRLGKASGDLYARGVVDSIEDANAAIKSAVSNGLVPDNASSAAIDQVSRKVSNLAKVMEEDSGRVGAAVSTMLKTGMAKSADEAFDMIQFGIERGLNKNGDLLDSFNEYPSVLKTIGMDGHTAFGLVSQGMQAGAKDSDKIVDALKELSVRAVDGSTATTTAFKQLGVNGSKAAADIAAGGPRASKAIDMILDRIRAMPATAQRAQIIQSLFGGPGEDLGAALFALDVDKASNALDGMAGAADRAGQTLEQSAGARLDAFKRRAQQALVDKLAQAVPWLEKVGNWAAQHTGTVTTLTTVLGGLAVTIGVVKGVTAAWSAVQAVAAGSAMVGRWVATGAAAAASGARQAWAWTVSGAGAVRTGAIYAVQFAAMIGRWIAAGAAATASAARQAAAWAVSQAGAVVAGLVSAGAFAVQVGGWIMLGVQSMLQAARVAAAWLIAMGPIGLVIASVIAVVYFIIRNWDTIVAWTKAAWGWVVDHIRAAWEWIKGIIATGWAMVVASFNFYIGLVRAIWSAIWGWVTAQAQNFVAGLNAVWGWMTSAVGAAVGFIRDRFTWLVSVVTGLPGRIAAAAGGMWDGIKNAFRAALNWVIGRWNGLSFRVPSVSFMGMTMGGFSLGMPHVPFLAKGGIVPATPGGRLAVIGEGGQDEAVIPLPKGARQLNGQSGPTQIVFTSDGSRLGEMLVELFREAVRIRGGNVQRVLGHS